MEIRILKKFRLRHTQHLLLGILVDILLYLEAVGTPHLVHGRQQPILRLKSTFLILSFKFAIAFFNLDVKH